MRKKIESWITVCDFCERTAGQYKCSICGKDLCKIHGFKLSNKEPSSNPGSYTMWIPTDKVLIACFCHDHLHEDLVQSLASKVKEDE